MTSLLGGGTPVDPPQISKTPRTPITKKRKIVPGSGLGLALSEGEEYSSDPDSRTEGMDYDENQEYEDDVESRHSSFHERLSQAAGAVGNALIEAGNILTGGLTDTTGGGSRRPSHAGSARSITSRDERAAARAKVQLAAEIAAKELAAREAAEEEEYQEELRVHRQERLESEQRIDAVNQRRHEEKVRLENERLYRLHEDNRTAREIDPVVQEERRLAKAQVLPNTIQGFPSMASLIPGLPDIEAPVLTKKPISREGQDELDRQAEQTELAIAQLQKQIETNVNQQSKTQVRTTRLHTGTFLYLKKREQTQKAVVSRFITALHKRTNDKAYLEDFAEKMDDALDELLEIKTALINETGLTAAEALEFEFMFKEYEKKAQGAKQDAREFLDKIREQDRITKGAKQKKPAGQATSTGPKETHVQTRASSPVAQKNLPVPTGPAFRAAPITRPPAHPVNSDSSDSRQPGGEK